MSNIDANKDEYREEEMREMAKEELDLLLVQQEKMEEDIRLMLIPKDPEDAKNAVFEIRGGTGGDEAALFAGDYTECTAAILKQKAGKWKRLM